MVQSQKLTAEALLSNPRRSAAAPNASGSLALYTQSTHHFGDKTYKELRVMNLATTNSTPLLSDASKTHDACWIPGTDGEVVYLRSGDKGHTEVVVASGGDVGREHYAAGEIGAPVADLKMLDLGSGNVAFVVTGLVDSDGKLFNEEIVEAKSTARVFDTPHIRIWSELYKENRYSLWYSTLILQTTKWTLSTPLNKLVNDNTLDVPFGMYELFNPADTFDISREGIAFLARDLKLRKPEMGLQSVPYYVPVRSFTQPMDVKPRRITYPAGMREGFGAFIRISPKGSTIGFLLCQAGQGFINRLYTADVKELTARDVIQVVNGVEDPEHDCPEEFAFAGDEDAIIFNRQYHGRSALSRLKLRKGELPTTFYTGGTVSSFTPLKSGKWDELLVSASSFMDSSLWQTFNVTKGKVSRTISSSTDHGAKFGLSAEMVQEIWYDGVDGLSIHSYVIRPADFDQKRKYPWVLLPHGGPVAAHIDAWSTKWNLAAWAEQGYVVVLPNISGSSGYGADFIRRVNNEFAGKPYQDLVKLIEHLETLLYLDPDKAVLAGGSYSAYLVSWFMGEDIIKKFCCAIWHEGIYSLPTKAMAADILFDEGVFPNALYPWTDPSVLEKWNPASPDRLRNWKHAPPTIVIHNEKDYRCPITEGLAMVKVLHGHGIPTRFLTFEDETHFVLKPENSLVWHDVVWGWMRRCVDGELRRGDTEW